MRDVTSELKELRLQGMAMAWSELIEHRVVTLVSRTPARGRAH